MAGDWSFNSGIPLPPSSSVFSHGNFYQQVGHAAVPLSRGLRGGDARYCNYRQAAADVSISLNPRLSSFMHGWLNSSEQAHSVDREVSLKVETPATGIQCAPKTGTNQGNSSKQSHTPPNVPNICTRSLAKGADQQLITYMRHRRLTPLFLFEIDMFLREHPEISQEAVEWAAIFNSLPPLGAYLWFIKGWTRPARYEDHVLDRVRPAIARRPIQSMATAYDSELVEFFQGRNYPYDVLHEIDQEVALLANKVTRGEFVSYMGAKLLSMAVLGNPVDVYKLYEYSYQDTFLEHRYLPEHSILTALPKPRGYYEPDAYVLPHPDERYQDDGDMRTHLDIRARMAEAHDSNIDVLEVLLQEFVLSLVRRQFCRRDVKALRQEAVTAIDEQREINGSADLVDLVMDIARNASPVIKPPRRRTYHVQTMPNLSGKAHSRKRQKSNKHERQVATRVLSMKAGLELLYDTEKRMGGNPQMNRTRLRLERELVSYVIDTGIRRNIISAHETTFYRQRYKKKGLAKREQDHGRIDVLNMLSNYIQQLC